MLDRVHIVAVYENYGEELYVFADEDDAKEFRANYSDDAAYYVEEPVFPHGRATTNALLQQAKEGH